MRRREFSLTCDQLACILAEVAQKYAGAAGPGQLREFCVSLKIEELVLARALRRRERATPGRPSWPAIAKKLYEMGLHIAREDSAPDELADSLYAISTELSPGKGSASRS